MKKLRLFDNLSFLEKRLVYGEPETGGEVVTGSAEEPEMTPEEALAEANKEAAEALAEAKKKQHELLNSDNPRKRAWGGQLKQAIMDHEPLMTRILEKQNKNKLLAENVTKQFKIALGNIARREEREGLGDKAPAEKVEVEYTDNDKEKGRQKLLLVLAKDVQKKAYTKATAKLNSLIKEENAKEEKRLGRDLGLDRLYSPREQDGTGNVANVAASRSPNVVKLYNSIEEIYKNNGVSVDAIQAGTAVIKSLATSAKFKEALDTDKIVSKLRYSVAVGLSSKVGKENNEELIRSKIDEKAEPLLSAKVGTSWEVSTTEGVDVTITKGENHYYEVEIDALSERGAKNYAMISKDLSKKPGEPEPRKVTPVRVAEAPKMASKPVQIDTAPQPAPEYEASEFIQTVRNPEVAVPVSVEFKDDIVDWKKRDVKEYINQNRHTNPNDIPESGGIKYDISTRGNDYHIFLTKTVTGTPLYKVEKKSA